MDASSNASSERKSALEGLDREELIQRCKNLLGIAKKAKQAKDECQTKIEELKEKLTECNTQKQADKECLKTMQVMVNSLTDNKLTAANKIADLEKTIKNLNQQVNNCNEKLSGLEIENEAKNKQIQRLTSENEEQEMDLRNLDERLAKVSELSQHQKQELLLLEQSVDRWKAMEAAHHKLQVDNKELQAKISNLQSELSSKNEMPISQNDDLIHSIQTERDSNRHLYEETKQQLDALQTELDQLKQTQESNDDDKIDVIKEQLQHENKQLQKQCDEQTHKLNKYKAKVCEFSSKLKELKVSKKLLSDTVLEYSNLVTKWQVQIAHASKLLINEVNQSNELKGELEKQLAENESVVTGLRATIETLENQLTNISIKTNEIGDIQEKYEALSVEHEKLSKILQEKDSEMASYRDLNEENTNLEQQLESKEQSIKDLNAKISELEDRLQEALKCNESNEIKEKYETLLAEYELLQKHVEEKNTEITNYKGLSEAKIVLEKRLETNESLISGLRASAEELGNRLLEVSKCDEAKVFREKCETLQTEFNALQIGIEEKNTEILELREAKIKLEQQIESSEHSIKDLNVKISELEERLQEANNESTEAKEKYASFLSEYQLIQKDVEEKNNEIFNYKGLAEAKIDLEKQLESNENLISNLRASLEELENRLLEVSKSDETKVMKEEYETLQTEINALQGDIEEKNGEISELKEAKIKLEQQIESSEQLVRDLRTTIDDLEIRLEDAVKRNETAAIKEKYEMLLIEYKSLQKDIEERNSEIGTLTQEFEQVCSGLKAENEKCNVEIQKQAEEHRNQSQQLIQLQENETVANEKNSELLAEMRELNDVLKARGEKISNQTAEIDQIKGQLSEQSKQVTALEEMLKEKTKQMEQLRNQFDNQSEILSTSTISRVDEVARMRDIEDSFEEKYNKLRALAVKLKKKVAEQQATIANLESNASSKSAETNNAAPIAPIQTQNLISLQKENDRLLDQIDSMKSEQKQFKTEINELKQQMKKADEEAKSLRIVNEDIKATADANLKIKSALDEKIKDGEKQIDALKNENKNVVQQLKNAENDIIKVKDIVKQKESEITQKEEEVTKIKSEINKLKASMKKSKVLNLEVEAYEKSLTEVSLKYDATVKQLSEAKNEIEEHQATIQKLTTEVQTLTNQLELEKQNSSEYQQQCELQRIKIKENGVEISELKRIIDDNVKETNHIKIELANLQSQQSENEVEKQKFISKLKNENETNVTKILSLEEEVQDLRSKLSGCELELANVQTDFASYKIRAQAVLRQNQSKDSSSEEELKEELAILTQAKDDLNKKLAHTTEQQRRLESTIDELKGEKANLQERCKKLLSLLDESRQQIETIQTENRKQTQEHHEALKMHRLQVDTLNNCYKTQIEEMQKKHVDEIATLKSKPITKATENADTAVSILAKGAQMTTEQRIELLMMERQDGEGSECTTHPRKVSTASRGKHEVIPLDELLNNTTFDEEQPNVEQDEHEEKVIPIEKFEAQQSRVKHLSTLLSEAEMDVARLTEMNTMLKEELRRQERSTEREKQMQNLEYMKNVIFKFLTINNADERAHLVPVLNIILKLSPDENKTLQSVARGGDGGGQSSGWSNLLPSW